MERDDDLKAAPQLAKAVLNPNTFQKMRVTNTVWVLNESTAAALELMAKERKNSGMMTTAWWIRRFASWFKILVSSHGTALSFKNRGKFDSAVNSLREYIEITRGISVGKSWKPWQRGTLVATHGFITIATRLLESKEMDFVYGSRFSSNCIENLFSVIRSRNPVPNAFQWKSALKNIILSQYSKTICASNYEHDLTEKFADENFGSVIEFLKHRPQQATISTEHLNSFKSDWPTSLPDLTHKDKNVLYYVCGYILDSVMGNQIVCNDCTDDLIVEAIDADFTEYTKSREYEEGLLTYVSRELYHWFEYAEKIFRTASARCSTLPDLQTLETLVQNIMESSMQEFQCFKPCHSIDQKLMRRFLSFRVKIHSAQTTREVKRKNKAPAVSAGSSTAGGHRYVSTTTTGKK
ncbi:uncharacterized protein LOC135943909 [Cloeon dipterum]|uniref:uncharacterized protein LOC135943909 n=1 Tax=Cloeon dipterum TaxID=197152 RepID=UPI0032208982